MMNGMKYSLLGLTLAVLLSACSGTQFGYRFLDNAMRWKLDGYVSLDREQSRVVNKQLRDFQSWHKSTQLPLYVDFLTQQKAALSQPQIDNAYLERSFNEVKQLLRQSVARLIPDLSALVAELDAEQIRELQRNLDKKARQYARENILIPPEKLQRERQQKMLKRLRTWIGSVSAEQEKMVKIWAENLQDAPDLRLQQRQLFYDKIDQLLSQPQNATQLTQQATPLLLYPERQWVTAYQQRFAYNKQLTFALLIDLHASLSDAQREQLLREIDQYRKSFKSLSGR